MNKCLENFGKIQSFSYIFIFLFKENLESRRQSGGLPLPLIKNKNLQYIYYLKNSSL